MKKIILHLDNIKEYAKYIKEISSDNLKHSELLHQLSQSLGFNNYQTLKGIADKNRGYLEVGLKYFTSPIIKKRFDELEVIKISMVQSLNNFVLNKNLSKDYFYERGLELLDIGTEALKAFPFIEYNRIDTLKIIKDYMSVDGILYLYCLSMKLDNQDIKEKIKKYFSYNNILNEDIIIIERELTGSTYYVSSFDNFISKIKPFEVFTSLKQQLAYGQQQWTFLINSPTISDNDLNISKRAKEYFKEKIDNNQSVIVVDKKSDIQNEAKRRLFKKITLINNCLYVEIDNMKQLKELLLLLNKKDERLDNIVFPCLFKYKDGKIEISEYNKDIHSKEYMRLYTTYKLLRINLFKEKNNLSYDASLNDFELISKDENINHYEYIEKTLKNTNLRDILTSINIALFDCCEKIEDYNRLKKMALYLISNYNLKNIEEDIKKGLISGCNKVKDNEFLKFLFSNKSFQKQIFLKYALGMAYGKNNSQIIDYLTKEQNVQFTKEVYKISLDWAIIDENLNKVKEISKSINIKEIFDNNFWVCISNEIIDFLISQKVDINKDSKEAIADLIRCNDLGKIEFLKQKGLILNFDANTKKQFLGLAERKGYFDFYDWLKKNIIYKTQ